MMSSANPWLSTDRDTVKPAEVDIPWPPVPSTVDVSAADAEAASGLWDRDMADYAGILEADQE